MKQELPRDQMIIEENNPSCVVLCPRCRTVLKPVEVHGHLQCVVCKVVIEECCQGQQS